MNKTKIQNEMKCNINEMKWNEIRIWNWIEWNDNKWVELTDPKCR